VATRGTSLANTRTITSSAKRAATPASFSTASIAPRCCSTRRSNRSRWRSNGANPSAYLVNLERGQRNVDYIIAKNLPDLRGKMVCDVGRSVGLLAYSLIKLGAKSVDGFE